MALHLVVPYGCPAVPFTMNACSTSCVIPEYDLGRECGGAVDDQMTLTGVGFVRLLSTGRMPTQAGLVVRAWGVQLLGVLVILVGTVV